VTNEEIIKKLTDVRWRIDSDIRALNSEQISLNSRMRFALGEKQAIETALDLINTKEKL